MSPQEALSQARSEEQRREELRDPGDRRSDLEQEMEQEKRELLERAARMRLEQEDEMRELNSVGPECSPFPVPVPVPGVPMPRCPAAAPGRQVQLDPGPPSGGEAADP